LIIDYLGKIGYKKDKEFHMT